MDLINVYEQIRLNWPKVCKVLRRHQYNHSKKYYYIERAREHRVPHERAAQFIYLNRTCWNGLYRVNLRGEFNVPIGTKNSVLLESDNFEHMASLLAKITLKVSDFEPVLDSAGKDDFLFVDPPYVTRHNCNGFLKYNEKIFGWDDQIRLAAAVKRAASRGAKILLTNADHPSITSLYEDVGSPQGIRALVRSSVLAADSKQRGMITEFALAVNYDPPK